MRQSRKQLNYYANQYLQHREIDNLYALAHGAGRTLGWSLFGMTTHAHVTACDL